MQKRTLLLAPYYLPLRAIPWEAAVKLKYEGLVDVLVEYEEEIRSPSVTWKIPAVIRLRKLGKLRVRQPKYSRVSVYQRDNWECQYCGIKCTYREATRDHVVPRAHGGRTTWQNTVLSCKNCNTRKGSQSCDTAGMFPRKTPVIPRVAGFTPPNLGEDIPPEWQGFTAGF